MLRPIGVMQQPGQITLVDGKHKELPADYGTAIRVRAHGQERHVRPGGAADQIVLGLQLSLEPKITWQNLVNLTITKAIDEQDQKLVQGPVTMRTRALAAAPRLSLLVRGPPPPRR